MVLKRNLLANFVSQSYVTLIGIVVVPFYLKVLGAEAYGLIGFFTVLQLAFNQLDAGLSAAMTRESARQYFTGDSLSYRRLLRSVNGLFLAVAVLIGGALFFGAGTIQQSWLQSSDLSPAVITFSIQTMAFALAARWYSGLQRGVIMGAERQVWLSGFNVTFATLRHPGALILLNLWGASVNLFFAYQATLAGVEVVALVAMTRTIIPALAPGEIIGWSLKPLRSVLGFSLSVSFTSLVWFAITQVDRAMLSALLPLAEFGAFMVAVTVAGGVLLAYGPIGLAVRPRLAKLHAAGDDVGFRELYRKTTQLVSIIAASTGITLAMFSDEFLLAWTQDPFVSDFGARIVALYALGAAILGVGALPFYLQFAFGDLRLHVYYNVISLIAHVPMIIAATYLYGAIGAGAVWLGWNLIFFFVWPLLVHRKFLPGIHGRWLQKDILPIYVAATAAVLLGKLALPRDMGPTWTLVGLAGIGCMALVATTLASREGRTRLRAWANLGDTRRGA